MKRALFPVLGLAVLSVVVLAGLATADEEAAGGEGCPSACSSEKGCSVEKGCSSESGCSSEKGCSGAAGCSSEKGVCSAQASEGGCCAANAQIKLTSADEGEKKAKRKRPELTCPVGGGPAKKTVSADYKEAKVYFCCPKCIDAFEKDTAKFATKANYQLVVSKQARQKACPFSGKKCNPETATNVAEAKVSFCCGGCTAKVNKLEGDKQLEAVFGADAFEKGFAVKKPREKKGDKKKDTET